MTISCSAYNCTNRHFKGTQIKFIDFHLTTKSCVRNGLLQQKGMILCPLWQVYICSKHFTTDDYRFSDSKKVK